LHCVRPIAPRQIRFGKWEKEISAFETTDKTQSTAEGSAVVHRFLDGSDVEVVAAGFSECEGHQSRIWRVADRGFDAFCQRVIFSYEPSKVFFAGRGNDLWAGKSAEQVFGDFKDFVAKVHGKLPTTEIVFISLSPSIARWKQADKERP